MRGLCALGAVDVEHTPLHAGTDEQISKAKQRELSKLSKYDVYTEVSRESMRSVAGHVVVDTKWVFKPAPDISEGIKARLVGREFAIDDDQNMYAGTPPLRAFRMLLSDLASGGPSGQSRPARAGREFCLSEWQGTQAVVRGGAARDPAGWNRGAR